MNGSILGLEDGNATFSSLYQNSTLAEWGSEPIHIYEVGVTGVIVVGAIFACGIVMAVLMSTWWILSYVSELTVDCILWSKDRCASLWCCRDKNYTVDADEIELEEAEEPEPLRVAE